MGASQVERPGRRTRVDRRRFIGGMAALGGAVASGAEFLGSSLASAQAAPKRGGIALLAFSDQNTATDTMDPRKDSFIIDHARIFSVGSTLVRLNGKAQPDPELALSWEPSPDAKMWTFKLREGVTFHDGKPFTSEDVVYSINLHRAPNESIIKGYFAPVKEIKADGKYVVRIELSEPNADFPMFLGSSNSVMVPSGFTDFDNFNGTGPFKVKSFKPGSRFIGERNSNYWKSGLPYLDGFELFGIPNAEARLNALLAGDVHFITRINPRQLSLVEKSGNARVASAKSGRFIDMPMMCDRAPFKDDLNLRLALKYATDREGMLREIRRGYGILGNDHPISPTDPFYCKDVPQRVFDADKAKFYFAKSAASGQTIELHTSEVLGSEAVDMAVHLQQSAARCGINIDVKREPTDGYYANIWMNRPFCVSGFQPRPTADLMLTLIHATGAKWNETRFNSERVDELLRLGRGTIDQAKRMEIYCEVERIEWEQGGMILPMFLDFLDGCSAKVGGFEPTSVGEAGAQRLTESIWLNA